MESIQEDRVKSKRQVILPVLVSWPTLNRNEMEVCTFLLNSDICQSYQLRPIFLKNVHFWHIISNLFDCPALKTY